MAKPDMLKCPRCSGAGTIPNPAAIGRSMRLRRQSLNISLRAFALLLDWSPAYLSDLENGKRQWTQAKVDRYERAFATL